MKPLSVSLVVCLCISAFLVFSCDKKEPEPPQPPQRKVQLPPPKPLEPPKQDVQKVKEEPKPKEVEKKPVPEKPPEKTLNKEVEPKKKRVPAVRPAPRPKKKPAVYKIAGLDGLNREFKTRRLNVWASETNKGVLLNGYVKSEREKQDALSLARQYNPNITDNINFVTVYDNSMRGGNR
jgi:hypothetical protein